MHQCAQLCCIVLLIMFHNHKLLFFQALQLFPYSTTSNDTNRYKFLVTNHRWMILLLKCNISLKEGHVMVLRSWCLSVRSSFIRAGHPLNSFSSLWAAFTLTVHINTFNESVHGKEEHVHATWINTIPLKISHLFGFSGSNRWSQRDSLACLHLDSRYSISLFYSNHFICDTSPLFGSHGNSFPIYMFDKRQFDYNRLLFWLSRSTCERMHV